MCLRFNPAHQCAFKIPKCRIVGQHFHSAFRAGQNGVHHIVDEFMLNVGVGEAHREVCAAFPGGFHREFAKVFKSDIPQPGQVFPGR